MAGVLWSRYPFVSADPRSRSWLSLLDNLGRSPATVDAYGRGLDQYLRFCIALGVDAADATLEHVSLFVRHLRGEAENPLRFDCVGQQCDPPAAAHRPSALVRSSESIKDCANAILCPAVACRQRAQAPMITLDFERGLVRRLSRMPATFRRTTTGFALSLRSLGKVCAID